MGGEGIISKSGDREIESSGNRETKTFETRRNGGSGVRIGWSGDRAWSGDRKPTADFHWWHWS